MVGFCYFVVSPQNGHPFKILASKEERKQSAINISKIKAKISLNKKKKRSMKKMMLNSIILFIAEMLTRMLREL